MIFRGLEGGDECNFRKSQTAKSPVRQYRAFCLIGAWQFPTLAWGDPTLPSALRRFTSEFGMGSGGTTALVPPGIFCFVNRCVIHTTINLISVQAENQMLSLSTKTPSVL